MRRGKITVGFAAVLASALGACSSGGSQSASPSAPAAASASEAAGTTIEVSGKDYAFEGLPEEVDAGTQLTFTNVSDDEQHLLIVVRKNDDVTRDLEDLLMNGTEEEQQSMTTEVGELFALPGETAEGSITLDEPGEYLALCPVPVGSMSSPGEDAMPHFMEGMYELFTVG